MANARIIDVKSTPVEPVKAKRGRPAGVGKRTFDYSVPRQRFNKPEDFQLFLAAYPDKRGLSGYLYRLDPVINMALAGQESSYIEVIPDPALMTYDYVAQTHGGGKYQLRLSDANRNGGSEAASTFFTIPMEEREPVLNPVTLVLDDRRNAQYIEKLLVRGVLIRDQSGAPRLKTETTMGDLLSEVRKVAGGAPIPAAAPGSDVLGQVVIELLRQRNTPVLDPGQQIQNAMQLADRLHPASNPVMDALLLKMIDRLTAPPVAPLSAVAPAPVPDMFETFEKVETFIERSAKRAAVSNDSGQGIFSQVVGVLGDLFKAAPQVISAYQVLRGGAAVPVAATALAPGLGAGVPGPVAVGSVPLGIEPDAITEMNCFALVGDPNVQARMMYVARQAAGVMARGVKGWDYALSLCAMEVDGRAIFRLLDLLGAGGILGALGNVPEVAAAVAADPEYMGKVDAWVNDFLSYDPAGRSEDDGGDIVEGVQTEKLPAVA